MTLLHARFEVLEEIGRGAQAATYRARDHHTGEEVALKELDFRRVDDWKAQELFEREGATLRALDHPAIPRYVDAFAVEDETSVRLFLVQEYVEGPTLAEELVGGRRWTEAEVVADARQLLEALAYLHDRSPPVIHRDVKPSNIIRRPTGRLALVDFGAVQNVLPHTIGGSTVIGTPGYMPMEQLLGRAVPATDLYALGATLIHLLTGTAPSDLPLERNRLRFADRVRCSTRLVEVLTRLTDPSVEDRYGDADEVLRALRSSLEADTLPTRIDLPRQIEEPIDASIFEAETMPPVETVEPGPRDLLAFPPRWATVRTDGDGARVVAVETRDAAEDPLDLRITDRGDVVQVRVRGPHGRRQLTTGLALLAAMVTVLLLLALKTLPLALLGGLAVLMSLFAGRGQARKPIVDIHIDPRTVRVTSTAGVHSEPAAGARWVSRGAELFLEGVDDPVLALSSDLSAQATWIAECLNTRTQQLATPTTDARPEFWKEQPVTVSTKADG